MGAPPGRHNTAGFSALAPGLKSQGTENPSGGSQAAQTHRLCLGDLGALASLSLKLHKQHAVIETLKHKEKEFKNKTQKPRKAHSSMPKNIERVTNS